jgi:Rrf2 family protein
VRISAKTDYALRAAIELAAIDSDGPVKGEAIATAQDIPLRFLENILGDLRNAGIVESRRGVEGGYLLARPADEIALADVVRAVDGPLANVAGTKPNALSYDGSAEQLREVWVAVRAALRSVLEETTIADVAAKKLPKDVLALVSDQDAWEVRP